MNNNTPSPSPVRRYQSAIRNPHSAILLCLVLLLSACAGKSRLKVGQTSDGEVVEAEGLAPYIKDDLIGTKRASLSDAQRSAVEKAVGVYVSGRTMVEKAIAIENNILARTDGYIKKFDVVSEGMDGDLYKTRIRALVAVRALEQDLKDMSLLNTPELERPRVNVRVDDEIEGKPSKEKVSTNEIRRVLAAQGYKVIDDSRSKDADLVISGKSVAFPFQTTGLGGFVSYRARLTLEAIRSGTDDTLLTISKEASGLGGNSQLAALKSLETVAGLAANEIAAQLPEAFAKGKSGLVFVENVGSFTDVERVKKHLAAQPEASDLRLRLYEEKMAQFEVLLGKGTLMEMAGHLEASKTLRLKVIESKPQLLRLKLE